MKPWSWLLILLVAALLAYFAGQGQGYADGYRAAQAEAEAHGPEAAAPRVQIVEVPTPFPVPGPVQIREVKVPEYITVVDRKIEYVDKVVTEAKVYQVRTGCVGGCECGKTDDGK